jgi:hypothetical protein
MLLQHLDDLLFGKSALAHVRLPKERTLPKIGDIYGEQVTPNLYRYSPKSFQSAECDQIILATIWAVRYRSSPLDYVLVPQGRISHLNRLR